MKSGKECGVKCWTRQTAKPRGPYPDKQLTALKAGRLVEPGRYADGNRLYLLVDRSGTERWMLRTVVHGKRRDIGLGELGTQRDQHRSFGAADAA
jgi:hypothetical protein